MAIPSDTSMDGDAAVRLDDPPSDAVNPPQLDTELQLVQELRGHDDRVWSASWSPKGDLLASCSGDKTVRIWGRQSGPDSQLVCKVCLFSLSCYPSVINGPKRDLRHRYIQKATTVHAWF